MKTCCNCGVSNPGCLTLCYACGKSVDARFQNRPMEMTRQCTFCGAPNLGTSANCFVCGDPLARAQAAATASPSARDESRYDSWPNGDPAAWREVERRLRAPAPETTSDRPRSWWQRLAFNQA